MEKVKVEKIEVAMERQSVAVQGESGEDEDSDVSNMSTIVRVLPFSDEKEAEENHQQEVASDALLPVKLNVTSPQHATATPVVDTIQQVPPIVQPCTGEYAIDVDKALVHIDLRYKSEPQIDQKLKTCLQTDINKYMRNLCQNIITEFNRRYSLLVKAGGKTSYEQWIVPAPFYPVGMMVKIFEQNFRLITDANEYKTAVSNFKICSDDPTVIDNESPIKLKSIESTFEYNTMAFFWVYHAGRINYYVYLFQIK
mmetsp:Transcript_8348/g.11681  ORF Transcript_8348/g.11681 Transcript_8348/m.11681 type:complete len:254 (-) Transcript_8348:122-883(-)